MPTPCWIWLLHDPACAWRSGEQMALTAEVVLSLFSSHRVPIVIKLRKNPQRPFTLPIVDEKQGQRSKQLSWSISSLLGNPFSFTIKKEILNLTAFLLAPSWLSHSHVLPRWLHQVVTSPLPLQISTQQPEGLC